MTIDEAIKHAEEVANANERLCKTVRRDMQLSDYGKCAEEHRQLAEWLKELKKVREQQDKIAQIIDDCDLEAWEVLEMIKEVMRA